VHSSGAYGELAWFQTELGIPVATTIMGKGSVPESHSLSLGVAGYVMGKGSLGHYTRKVIDDADVIFLVGTRTNQNGTNGWKLFPGSARFIHCDVDCREIGRNYESLRLLGDAKLTLAALQAEIERRGTESFRSTKVDVTPFVEKSKRSHARDIAKVVASDAVPIRPERVMRELDRFIDDGTVMCADASYATVWLALCIASRKAGMRFITPRGLAGIGWGFPMALGCALADRSRRVVCVSGDGGFGYAWSEMETAVRHRLDIVQIVLNNSVLGYQKDAEDASYARHADGLHFMPVDHAAIARACGWRAFRVETPDEIESALKSAFSAGGPAMIEIVSDPGAWPPIQNFDGKIPDSYAPDFS
jgi:acetolactate synthase-1/2/3 large subunit